jgi:cell fate regulator YaaT (PSP1 superfamily)
MTRVTPVNLPYNVHTLWFDPAGVECEPGQKIVVETARGTELAVCAGEQFDVSAEEIERLKSPLKPVLRVATDDDLEMYERMQKLSREAMPKFRELARETSEGMHPVSCEFLLDGDKAVFYFEAEERIDFRDLVRKLAAQFHVRIDMRQIGVRDEARIVGGIGHCGQEICCKRLGGEFKPVSIRMAKDQDLSLNPQKISGLCGRLMCCLRYENDVYKDFKSRAPRVGAAIVTPVGEGKVCELDIPREIVAVKVADTEKPVRVPLAWFDEPEAGQRPHVIGARAWADAQAQLEIKLSAAVDFQTSKFTGADKLGQAKAVYNGNAAARGCGRCCGGAPGAGAEPGAQDEQVAKPTRRARRSRASQHIHTGKQAQGGAGVSEGNTGGGAKVKVQTAQNGEGVTGGRSKRRSTKISGGKGSASGGAQVVVRAGAGVGDDAETKKVQRPGQRSSGLANNGGTEGTKQGAGSRRRKRGGSGGASAQGQAQQAPSGRAGGGAGQESESPKPKKDRRRCRRGGGKSGGAQAGGANNPVAPGAQHGQASAGAGAQDGGQKDGSHRRRRRRSRKPGDGAGGGASSANGANA